MSSPTFIPIIVVGIMMVVMLISALLRWKRRRKLLRRLQDEWGRPRDIDRDLKAIAAYHESVTAHAGEQTLDLRTSDDLDLNALFAFLDRTESAPGRQMLYHRLLASAGTPGQLEEFDLMSDRFREDKTIRLGVQAKLNALATPDAYYLHSLVMDDFCDLPWWRAFFPVFAIVMAGMICLAPVWPQTLLALLLGPVISLVLRGVIFRRMAPWIGPFRQLGSLIAVASSLFALGMRGLQTMHGELADHLPHLRRLARIAWWASRDPCSSSDLEASILEYMNMLFLLDGNAMVFGFRELRRRKQDLHAVLQTVALIDTAISTASVREGAQVWTRPDFARGEEPIVLRGMYHPLLARPVANSVTIEAPFGLLVTGANMAGKSTFIRTVGMNVILAQSISTVFASAYKAPWLAVKTCIGRRDDLEAGRSYYQDEVQRVLSLIQAAEGEQQVLLLFDELFRGTNTVDRIAAGIGVLSYLMRRNDDNGLTRVTHRNIIIVATHDLELSSLAASNYHAYHFDGIVTIEGLVFDYVLRPGASQSRNAIALLDSLGAPAELVKEARARAKEIENGRAG